MLLQKQSPVTSQQVSALVLLDLSAAFDTDDHQILLDRLSLNFGLSGSALSLLRSYLSNRTQSVLIDSCSSQPSSVISGVPQGSVLGPLLFSLYLTPLSDLLEKSDVLYHCYADDTQLYISFSANDSYTYLSFLAEVLDSVHLWLSANRLSLNPAKTEFLLVGTPEQRSKLNSHTLKFSGTLVPASESV